MTTQRDVPQVIEREIEVPLDHNDPDGPVIDLFAREVVAPDGADRPYLLFLQGGPGGEPPRPQLRPVSPAWLERALRDFRVLLLDQRGTGRSTPLVGVDTMEPAEAAAYLTHFRADSIVADAEVLRAQLGVERWSVLGQSFGGFCALTYLSRAPEALAAVYLTGGVPPVGLGPADVYAHTYPTMAARSRAYWSEHQRDLGRYRRLLERCDAGEVRLASGEPFTAHRLRHTGQVLGMSYGAATLHGLLERDPDSPAFRHDLATATSYTGRSPLYSLLLDASAADGTVTDWAAARTLPEEYADRTLFFGEHVFPATFADAGDLSAYAGTAELLAQHRWPRLYDESVLSTNRVPGAAAVYTHDAYVDRELSLQTLAEVPGIEAWVTDEHEHDGLRTSGQTVLDRLFSMVPPPT